MFAAQALPDYRTPLVRRKSRYGVRLFADAVRHVNSPGELIAHVRAKVYEAADECRRHTAANLTQEAGVRLLAYEIAVHICSAEHPQSCRTMTVWHFSHR